MKFAVISDTHNDIENLKLLIEKISNKVDFVIHLGDDITDTDILEEEFEVIKVPGVYEQIYTSPEIKRRIIKEFNKKKFLITHCAEKHSNDPPGEPTPQELSKQVDVVLYGHTHIPEINQKQDGKIWLNPGHMKQFDKRGYPASYAIVELDDKFKVKIFELLSDKVIKEFTE